MVQSHTSQHWSHLPRCEFIQLAMIKDDQVRRGGPEEERVRLAQQGKIEIIMRQKEEIDLPNIFLPLKSQPPPPPPPSPSLESPIPHQTVTPQPIYSISIFPPLKRRVILIEGAPGGGKSTLALHICHMWAREAFFLNSFDIVIIAYLRDEAIQNASNLANILPAADVAMVSQSSSDIATQIKASYGFKVLFIFDGWDEFPPNLQNNSLISTIIRQPHKLCLQQSTVIVTTRPVASGNLLHIADRRVEILGFTPHQIHEYIEKALNGDSTRIQKLVEHLKEHPVIEGYCYIPLHAAILVHIFLTMKEVLPTTLHELFCDLVLCCIVRELETHKSNVEIEISSLDDLPDVIKSQLGDLCALAYKGVMQEEVVFYQRHLQALDLPSNLPSLGLLQAVEGLTRFSKSLSYNFLHLSVQELLAAYNISLLDPGEQVEVFKNLFGSARFQPVLHSFCGFTKLENPAIQGYISTFLQENSSADNLLPFLHCFFEAQEPNLCQLVGRTFRKLTLNSIYLNPADHVAVGYFITSLLSTSATDKPHDHVHLELNIENEHCLKLLIGEIVKYKKPITGTMSAKISIVLNPIPISGVIALLFKQLPISELSICNDQLVAYFLQSSPVCELFIRASGETFCEFEESLMLLAEILQMLNFHITKLQVINSQLQSHFNFCFFQALQHNTQLVHLDLSGTKFTATEDTVQALSEMIQVNKTLVYLNLSKSLNFQTSGAQAHNVFAGLQHNVTLVHLNLSGTGIDAGKKTSKAMTKMLQVNKKLEHLNLSDNNKLSDEGAQCIFIGLQHNTTLVHLDLAEIEMKSTSETVKALNKMLRMNKTLTFLNLSHNQVTHYIFLGLQLNTVLDHLDLRNTGITINRRNAQTLTKMLQLNKTLTHLNLSYNSITDVGAQSIFKGLQHNNTLLHLMLRYTRITDEGAMDIAQLIYMNHSLQTLDISGNRIGSKGLIHIAKSLESNASLIRVDISDHYDSLTQIRVEAIHGIREHRGLQRIIIDLSK